MNQFPAPDEWRKRTERLQELLRQHGLQGCLITQNVGIYYYTGSMQLGYLLIPSEGEPAFYVRRSLARAQRESQVRVVELGSFRKFGEQLVQDYPVWVQCPEGRPRLGADLDVMPAQLYLRLHEAVPQAIWKDASAILRQVRSIKSAYEIGRISAAAEVAANALDVCLGSLHEGMTELDCIGMIEQSVRKQGHIGLMRMRGYNQETITGVVAAGEAAAEPTYFDGPAGGRGLTPAAPQSASRRPIAAGEPILLDIGCCIDGYVIDQTRTAVIGQLSPELQAAYDASVRILRDTELELKPGAIPELIYTKALERAASCGLADHFMGYGRDQVKFLGHGIGLEIDEWPVLAKGFTAPLEAGMVIAVEPKFTFPGQGVVGVENSYLITEDGCIPLTLSPERLYRI